MKQQKVVAIGSTLIDVFIQSNEFGIRRTSEGRVLCQLLGDKIEVENFKVVSGGGGSNTAVGFAKQGFSVSIMTEMGKDVLATQALQELAAAGVETKFVTQEKREETGMSVILVAPNGERTVMVHRGAASMLEKRDINWEEVEKANWVHLSSVSGQLGLIEKLFQTKKAADFKISWNPGKRELAALNNYQLTLSDNIVEILLLNKQEWESLNSLHSVLKSKIKLIIITNGRYDGEVWQEGQHQKYSALKTTAKEETGAGDAFGVGFVSAYLREENLNSCLSLAKKNAASVVKQVGAKAGLLAS